MKKYFVLLLIVVFTLSLSACSISNSKKENLTAHHPVAEKQNIHSNSPVQSDLTNVKAINWDSPSNGPYPTLSQRELIWLDVSVRDQKVYVKNGDRILYTMVASTGLNTKPDDSTPNGTFYIQPERGQWFYSPIYNEGAEYWVSWKNHGEFLFHSVPMNQNKQVIQAEAVKLGKQASHGCIRLTIPDAKWIYENIKTGTKVVIRS